MELNDILHAVSENLLIPAMIILVLLLVIAAICIGSLIVEALTERRYFKVDVPKAVNAINSARPEEVAAIIEELHVLRNQKRGLLTVAENMKLPDQDLFSLAKVELARMNDRHQRSLRITETITKIGPIMGLICTLIPLGPGIVAMGQGNVEQLSESMLIAFDGTVSGLVAAAVAMVITTIRKRWYSNYNVILEALMGAVLEKAEEARAEARARGSVGSGAEVTHAS